ncbi:hypothetical protein V1478_002927 [Vespula squamosa]|uniref:Uncharacterized protein n=1 Tax=Vespula squamosa TaxID=30214 RepID=A0ABD2BR92_VESSQ
MKNPLHLRQKFTFYTKLVFTLKLLMYCLTVEFTIYLINLIKRPYNQFSKIQVCSSCVISIQVCFIEIIYMSSILLHTVLFKR